jgi:Fe2+ or Zn2+ uptake regulation protein
MRKTKLTNYLIEILQSSKQPLSIPEILEKLKSIHNLTPNKTTLYRQFEKLTQANEVEEILLTNNVTHYELKQDHHHHFICNECDTIKCLKDQKLEEEIHKLEHSLETKGLQITQHQFSLSGQCESCQVQ